MTRRSPSCSFWCAWAIGFGAAIGTLLGWLGYDESAPEDGDAAAWAARQGARPTSQDAERLLSHGYNGDEGV